LSNNEATQLKTLTKARELNYLCFVRFKPLVSLRRAHDLRGNRQRAGAQDQTLDGGRARNQCRRCYTQSKNSQHAFERGEKFTESMH
jgi:hypothetical protein